MLAHSRSKPETPHANPCPPPRLRQATASDIETLVDLKRLCCASACSDGDTRAELQRLLRVFPQGQSVIECAGQVRGSVGCLIVDLGDDEGGLNGFDELSVADPVATHDPDGDTLYSVNTYVHPSAHSNTLRQMLCEGRRELCRWLNLRRILAVTRTVGYASRTRSMTPDAYLHRVTLGEIEDAALSTELREGFVIQGALRQSVGADLNSELAARVEWRNPDYEPPVARFPARSRSGVMLRPTASIGSAVR